MHWYKVQLENEMFAQYYNYYPITAVPVSLSVSSASLVSCFFTLLLDILYGTSTKSCMPDSANCNSMDIHKCLKRHITFSSPLIRI